MRLPAWQSGIPLAEPNLVRLVPAVTGPFFRCLTVAPLWHGGNFRHRCGWRPYALRAGVRSEASTALGTGTVTRSSPSRSRRRLGRTSVDPDEIPVTVEADRVPLWRLVVIDGARGVAHVEVENVGIGVVLDAIELDVGDRHAHGFLLRANEVMIRP